MKIYTLSNNRYQWCICSNNRTKIYDSEEIHAFFIDILEITKDCVIFVRNLDNYFIDIVKIIDPFFKDSTPDGKPKPEMGEYNYLVSDDGKCFSITINNGNATIDIRNFELLIPIKKDEELIETYNPGENTIKNVSIAMYNAILQIIALLEWDKIPLTLSSLALKTWQRCYNPYDLRAFFKNADKEQVFSDTLEKYLRPAYHGGWCYLNYNKPQMYKKWDHINGVTLDVNSLYPYVMTNCPLPYGKPYEFKGNIPEELLKFSKQGRAYFYVRLRCHATIKPGHLPCIQIGGYFYRDWLETTHIYGENVPLKKPEMTLTQTDYELLLEHYDITDMEILDGVYFKASKKLFTGYIERFYNLKKNSKNPGERKIAKMLLNTLSGNMAKKRKRTNMILSHGDSTEIFSDSVTTFVKGVNYISIGAAITSYARAYIIKYAHENINHFIYSDTDSLHLDDDNLENIPISDNIGDFKVENRWNEAIFFTKKIYMEKRDYHDVNFKCSGLDNSVGTMIVEFLRAHEGSPVNPGLDGKTFNDLRWKFASNGAETLIKEDIPYIERVYHDFTYDIKYSKMRLKLSKKPPKVKKLLYLQ